MIYVNIFNIREDQQAIQVSVETSEGNNITSVKLWTVDTYKNEAIDFTSKLQQINNKEVFLIFNSELGQSTPLTGIYFIEFESDATNVECSSCNSPVIAVTANLSHIKECLLNKLLELSTCGEIFSNPSCNGNEGSNIVNLHLIMQGIHTALTLGYYDEAINLYNSTLKLCDLNCCCDEYSDNSYYGLTYATLNNSLILI